jgi:hypothetical protein
MALVAVCRCIPRIEFWMPEPIYMKLAVSIMAPEPISTASVCLNVYPTNVARQRFGKNIKVSTNIRAKIAGLLDVFYSIRVVSE